MFYFQKLENSTGFLNVSLMFLLLGVHYVLSWVESVCILEFVKQPYSEACLAQERRAIPPSQLSLPTAIFTTIFWQVRVNEQAFMIWQGRVWLP